jgi:hypothetical protein
MLVKEGLSLGNPAKEEQLSPEFWNGHSLSDDCLWAERERPTDRSPLNFLKEGGSYFKTESTARSILEGYLTLPDHTPIRTFTDGAMFDGTLYPEGTIIRYRDERLYTLGGSGKSFYLDTVRWGVTIRPGNEEDLVLVTWMEGFIEDLRKPQPGGSHRIGPILKTGEVEHERTLAGHGFSSGDRLSKISMVELMKAGIGIVKEAPRERRTWLGRRVGNQG